VAIFSTWIEHLTEGGGTEREKKKNIRQEVHLEKVNYDHVSQYNVIHVIQKPKIVG